MNTTMNWKKKKKKNEKKEVYNLIKLK
jgi:hypothetical protein